MLVSFIKSIILDASLMSTVSLKSNSSTTSKFTLVKRFVICSMSSYAVSITLSRVSHNS